MSYHVCSRHVQFMFVVFCSVTKYLLSCPLDHENIYSEKQAKKKKQTNKFENNNSLHHKKEMYCGL
jgi:hypothetical protein